MVVLPLNMLSCVQEQAHADGPPLKTGVGPVCTLEMQHWEVVSLQDERASINVDLELFEGQ